MGNLPPTFPPNPPCFHPIQSFAAETECLNAAPKKNDTHFMRVKQTRPSRPSPRADSPGSDAAAVMETRDVPGKGLGVIATRDFDVGEIVSSEPAPVALALGLDQLARRCARCARSLAAAGEDAVAPCRTTSSVTVGAAAAASVATIGSTIAAPFSSSVWRSTPPPLEVGLATALSAHTA